MKYKAKVNDHFQFDISENSTKHDLDLVPVGERDIQVLRNGKAYRAKVVSVDFPKKIFVINVNGRNYDLKLSDEFDQLVSKLGLEVSAVNKIKDVKAPMPGLVLDVVVERGQEVQKGDKLLVLEAMKMENVIKADGEGVVKNLHVVQGAAVDKGQLLIEME